MDSAGLCRMEGSVGRRVLSTRFLSNTTTNQTRIGRVLSPDEVCCVKALMREFSGCRSELTHLLTNTEERPGGRGRALHIGVFEMVSTVLFPWTRQRKPGKQPPVKAQSAILAWHVPNRCIHVVFAATDEPHRGKGLMGELIRLLQQLGLPLIIHSIDESEDYWCKLGFKETLKVRDYRDELRLPGIYEMKNTKLLVSKSDKECLALAGPPVRRGCGSRDDESSSETEDEVKDEASSKGDAKNSSWSTQRPSWWPEQVCKETNRVLQPKVFGARGENVAMRGLDKFYRMRVVALRPGSKRSCAEAEDSLSSFPSTSAS